MRPTPDLVASLCAYAVEGGLDGRYQPATIFNPLIALGRLTPPSEALSLWDTYEEVLTAAAAVGVRNIRLEVSWARLEPHRGQINEAAFARYRSVIDAARARGLTIEIAACDGAWPSWLGMEPLLWPWTHPVATAHLARVAGECDQADGVIFLARPDQLAQGYTDSSGPPWRRRAHEDALEVTASYQRIVLEATAAGWLRPLFSSDQPERALLGGVGPLARSNALLHRVSGEWRPTAS